MHIDETDTVWYRGKEILLQDVVHAAITISDLFGEVVGAVFGKALLSENGEAKARICSRVHNMNVDRIADMCTMIQMASNENFEGKNTQKYFPTKQSLKDTVMNIADYAFVLYDGILRCYNMIDTLDDDMPIDAIGEFVSVHPRAFNMASLYMRHGRLYTNYVKKHKKEGEFIEVPDNFKLSDNNTFYIKTRTNYLKECIMNGGLVFKKFDLDSENPSIRYKIFLTKNAMVCAILNVVIYDKSSKKYNNTAFFDVNDLSMLSMSFMDIHPDLLRSFIKGYSHVRIKSRDDIHDILKNEVFRGISPDWFDPNELIEKLWSPKRDSLYLNKIKPVYDKSIFEYNYGYLLDEDSISAATDRLISSRKKESEDDGSDKIKRDFLFC